MNDPNARSIALAIARARGHAPQSPMRALNAEIEALHRRLAVIEARITMLTTLTGALAVASGLPIAQAIASAIR